MRKKAYEISSGNAFKDPRLPNAEEYLIRAQLIYKIDTIMKQTSAAELFGVRQPGVSKMLRGDFRQFAVERLLRFLVNLDQDIEIIVRPHRRNDEPALHAYSRPFYTASCSFGAPSLASVRRGAWARASYSAFIMRSSISAERSSSAG